MKIQNKTKNINQKRRSTGGASGDKRGRFACKYVLLYWCKAEVGEPKRFLPPTKLLSFKVKI